MNKVFAQFDSLVQHIAEYDLVPLICNLAKKFWKFYPHNILLSIFNIYFYNMIHSGVLLFICFG